MKLRHIEIFNAIMLTGSVSGAARLVNLTQPAVSRSLQHAELQLGMPLFRRAKGRLVPTPEALALYPHIESLFAKLDEVQRLAGNLKAGQGGEQLRVLTALTLSYVVLPLAVRQFRKAYPGTAVRIVSVHSSQLVSGLALQEADIGLVLSAVSHPALTYEPLAEGRMVCVAPLKLLPARIVRRGTITLAELAQHPIIALDASDPLGSSLGQACREAGIQLQSDITVQTYHAALAFAHHGMGIAVVDSFTALSADPRAVCVLPLEPLSPVSLGALRPVAKPASRALQAFVECVRATVNSTTR